MKNYPGPALVLTIAAALFAGCATKITSDVVQNPPPAEKLSNFTHFEMLPLRLVPPYAGQAPNEVALVKIQENVDARMQSTLATWNSRDHGPAATRTLVIEPVIDEIKFISGGKRALAGAYAGSSAVILRAHLKDKETGAIIASPEFYAKAAALGGAWSFGGTDNAMLVRIANRLSDYLIANFDAAVGGPSGAESKE